MVREYKILEGQGKLTGKSDILKKSRYIPHHSNLRLFLCKLVMTSLNNGTTTKGVYDVKTVSRPSNLGLFFVSL